MNWSESISRAIEYIENDYKKGIDDEKYYSEIWIPIKKK